jgi:hypothetical protein
MFSLLQDKNEAPNYSLLTPLEIAVISGDQKFITVDSEAAVISAKNKVFLESVITGCNFQCNRCLWRQIQTNRLHGGIQRR